MEFLVIVKCRGSRAHRRFYHNDTDDCNENDKERLLAYIHEKKIKKPLDIWFNNLKAIMEYRW